MIRREPTRLDLGIDVEEAIVKVITGMVERERVRLRNENLKKSTKAATDLPEDLDEDMELE